MKEIKWNPIYEYSCMICGKNFKSKEELRIQLDLSPLCSSRCLFKLYYNILSKYDIKHLRFLAKTFKIKNYSKLEDKNLIYEVCKKYPKLSLSSINTMRTEDKDRTGQDRKGKQRTEDRTTPPLCNKGVSCTPVLSSGGNLQ